MLSLISNFRLHTFILHFYINTLSLKVHQNCFSSLISKHFCFKTCNKINFTKQLLVTFRRKEKQFLLKQSKIKIINNNNEINMVKCLNEHTQTKLHAAQPLDKLFLKNKNLLINRKINKFSILKKISKSLFLDF